MQRVLSVSGVADAIHIATYYIGNILIEANERQPYAANSSYRPSSYASSRRPQPYAGSSYVPGYTANPYAAAAPPPMPHGQLQTQQIYIPNDLVGCIIGKGGAKINEIRHMSASQIKIMEPGAAGQPGAGGAPGGSENERLVVITGAPANIQMAVQLLYSVRRGLPAASAFGRGGETCVAHEAVRSSFTETGAGEAEAAAGSAADDVTLEWP
jgi:heterogeneous nuclear rnp K-like protein